MDISGIGGGDFGVDFDTTSILTNDFGESAGTKTSYYFPEGMLSLNQFNKAY